MATPLPKAIQRELDLAEAQLAAQSQQAPDLQHVVTDASQLPAPQTQATPAPAPTAPAAPPAHADDFEQKYRTAVGRYNAELPPLKAKVTTYESQLVALQEQVRALAAAAQKPAEPPKPAVDPRDVDSFGQDMMEMVHRYITAARQQMQEQIDGVVSRVDHRLAQLEQSVTGVSQKTESTLESQFYAALAQLVPDYERVNASDAWLAWLAEIDEVYGVPRQAALEDAFSRHDVKRTAVIFNQFKAARPVAPRPSLESQVAPAGGGAYVPPPAPTAKPLLSQKFVEGFYMDQVRGKYRGREQEEARIEAEINQAAAEGRIV